MPVEQLMVVTLWQGCYLWRAGRWYYLCAAQLHTLTNTLGPKDANRAYIYVCYTYDKTLADSNSCLHT